VPELVKDGLDDPSNRPVIEAMASARSSSPHAGDVIACLGASQSAKLRACHEKKRDMLGAPSACRTTSWKKAAKRDLVKYSQVKSTKGKARRGVRYSDGEQLARRAHVRRRLASITTTPPKRCASAVLAKVDGATRSSILSRHVPGGSYDIYLDGYVCPQPSLVLLFACSKSADGPTCEQSPIICSR